MDGWSPRHFRDVLGRLGYAQIETRATTSDERELLVNVVASAVKPLEPSSREARVAAEMAILRRSMNGENPDRGTSSCAMGGGVRANVCDGSGPARTT